jgi:large subunit ribosomal protein L17
MRHRVVGKKLNRDKDHRQALLKNLASALILNGKIETSVVKAKFVKPFVEKLITKAKDNSFNSIRLIRSRLGNEDALRKLIAEVAPEYKERNGGYTRIKKLGIIRKGDNSEMAMIELVTETKPAKEVKEESKKVAKPKTKKETKVTPEDESTTTQEVLTPEIVEEVPTEITSEEEEK